MLSHWLRLFYTPYIGPARFKQLLAYFNSVEEAATATKEEWRAAGMPTQVLSAWHKDQEKRIEGALHWLNASKDHHIIPLIDEAYPPLLKEIPDPPPLLFVKGNKAVLSQPQIAIVGTRYPTKEGRRNSYQFAKELAQSGFVISSGLAKGVDTEAHRGALSGGSTIAVLGTGLTQIYPAENRKLSEEIITSGGAMISELPLHAAPRAENFPRRNRIISGLSIGIVIVEAAKQSGSLITARLALEQNREVFAIPGSIHNPQTKGTHQLIRQGAKLTESTLDIIEELQGWIPHTSIEHNQLQSEIEAHQMVQERLFIERETREPKDPALRSLYRELTEPKSIDELVEILKIDTHIVATQLLSLELEGFVTNVGSGRYQRSS